MDSIRRNQKRPIMAGHRHNSSSRFFFTDHIGFVRSGTVSKVKYKLLNDMVTVCGAWYEQKKFSVDLVQFWQPMQSLYVASSYCKS